MTPLLKKSALALIFLLSGASGFAVTLSPLQHTFAVHPGGHLRLTTDLGSVEVRPSGDSAVSVTVERDAPRMSASSAEDAYKRFEVTFNQKGDDVEIVAKYDKKGLGDYFFNDGPNPKFVVVIPASFDVNASTGGGGIKVGDLRGAVEARSGGGGILLDTITGNIKASTGGGGISFKRCNGDVDISSGGGGLQGGEVTGNLMAQTGGGAIAVEKVDGVARVHTSGGPIALSAMRRVDADTSGGSISVRLLGQPDGDCSLRTSGGTVNLSLPATARFNLDASTSGGHVSSDLALTSSETDGDRGSLRGTANGGGPAVVVRSSGGSIHISKM